METKHTNTVQDTIERYVYQVARRLPGKSRKDIEAELRGLVEDMLEARCGDIAPEKKDVDIVLMELGSPAAFAARYGNAEGQPRYLVGPSVFPQYLSILKLVLLVVAIGMTVVSVIQTVADAGAVSGFALFGMWLRNILGGAFSAAAVVTLIFAVLEWRGVRVDELNRDWLAELPPVPRKQDRISRSDCVFGIVATLIFLMLFLAAPRYLAVFAEGNVIPIFNMELFPRLLPLVAVSCLLGVCKEIAKLLEGRYTLRLAIGLTAANAVSMALAAVVLLQPIWNRSLVVLLDEAVGLQDPAFLSRFWDAFGQVFLAAVLLGFAVDLISLWVRTLRGNRAA